MSFEVLIDMKMRKLYFGLLSMSMVWGACDESEPAGFEPINAIYLNNRSVTNTLMDSTSLTFVYVSADTIDVPVRVQLLGRPAEQARPVDIQVSSETAVEGVDYVLKTASELPGGETTFDYIVQLKRTPVLKQEIRCILVEVKANDFFTLPLAYEVQAGGDTASILQYRIYFSDTFTAPPVGWRTSEGGEFSQQKFELICRVLEIDPADFNEKNKISIPKWIYIQTEMTLYIREQDRLKAAGQPYDAEAFDKETGEPLKFGSN